GAAHRGWGDHAAFQGLDGRAGGQLGGGIAGRGQVIGEDLGELGLVSQQLLQGGGRDLGERGVVRGEHGDVRGGVERVHQAGRLDRRDQGGQRGVGGGGGGHRRGGHAGEAARPGLGHRRAARAEVLGGRRGGGGHRCGGGGGRGRGAGRGGRGRGRATRGRAQAEADGQAR